MLTIITVENIQEFAAHLRSKENSDATVEKYIRAVTLLFTFLSNGKKLCKEHLLLWKEQMISRYSTVTVNGFIAAVNGFLDFICRPDLRLRAVKTQRKIYRESERELTFEEYLRLLNAAKIMGNMRLFYIMETLASSGIRISELQFITVESLKNGQATVNCKGKERVVFLTDALCRELRRYCKSENIISGSVFVTKNGNPVDRSNVWKEMKKLCAVANVDPHKVFPHNFRHLFAVTYYNEYKDVAKLADILGHSSINTTRIYLMESGETHKRQMEKLGFIPDHSISVGL